MFVSLILGCKNISRLINKSGTAFTIEIETAEPNKEEIVQQAVKVIESRINAVGLDGEVSLNPDQANRIIVKLFGSTDLEREKKFLFTANQLELKKVVSPAMPAPLQFYPTKEATEQAMIKDKHEVLPYSEREGNPANFIIVEKDGIINGSDISNAQALPGSSANDYYIAFSLKKDGAMKFGDWTGKNINSYLAVILDKKVISTPFIKSQIFDNGQIDGRFTKLTAEDLALSLMSGYLPAKIKVIEEKSLDD